MRDFSQVTKKLTSQEMASPHGLTIDGVTYRSKDAAAKALGMSRRTLYRRLERIIDDREIPIEVTDTKHGRPKPVVFRGVTYPSITAAARSLGLSRQVFRDRLSGGRPLDAPPSVSPKPIPGVVRGKPVVVQGVTYPSLTTAARTLGLGRQAIQERLRSGRPLEAPSASPKPIPVVIAGVQYRSLHAAAKALNISKRKARRLGREDTNMKDTNMKDTNMKDTYRRTYAYLSGFRLPDEKWKAMKRVWDACAEAQVPVPDGVRDFFNNTPPDSAGVRVELTDLISVARGSDGLLDPDYYDIDLTYIPPDIKVLRITPKPRTM